MYQNRTFRKGFALLITICLLGAAPVAMIVKAGPFSPPGQRLAPGGVQPYADFDGDGYSDLAVGVPFEDIAEWPLTFHGNEGSVNALYGSSAGISGAGDQTWSQASVGIGGRVDPEEHFGSALTAGDFNGDSISDLAIGVPQDTSFAGPSTAGGVNIIYGQVSSGLANNNSQYWTQDSGGIAGAPEEGDLFGTALAAGDFDGDGFADLAIGIPGEEVMGSKAGAVEVLYGTPGGLSSARSQLWAESGSGLAGIPVADGDKFGTALAVGDFNGDGFADLAIGIPGKEVFPVIVISSDVAIDAGSVRILFGSATGLTVTGTQVWTQNSNGVHSSIADTSENNDLFGSALAAGDFDGDGFCDLSVGVPGEDLSGISACGAVNVIYGGSGGLNASGNQFFSRFTQGGISGGAVFGAHFGQALVAADINRDGRADLAVGVPFDTVSGQIAAGSVTVIFSTLGGLSALGSVLLAQDNFGLGGLPEAGDHFGLSLTAGDYDANGSADLVIGVPDEDYNGTDAGIIQIVYSNGGLQSNGSQIWSQGTSGVQGVAEINDRFGFALR